MNRIFSLLLAVLFLMINGVAASAIEQDAVRDSGEFFGVTMSVPDSGVPARTTSLTVELVTEGIEPGLYVMLKNVPQDLSEVTVRYAFGSPDYIFEDFSPKAWYTNPDKDEALCQVDGDGSVGLLCYRADEHPLSAYLSGAVNSLWIQVSFDTEGYKDGMTFDPVLISHKNTYEIPQVPPPFSADFELGWYSYSVIGHFADFPPNVAQVSSTYSWDGVDYQSCMPGGPMRWQLGNLGNEDAAAKNRLENQECAEYYAEPLKSFLAHERDSFYLRLEITTEDGEVYFSQPAFLSREEAGALPVNLIPRAYLGFDLSVTEERNDKGLSLDDENYYAELVSYTFGQLQLTVREDATQEEIMALLPETVPVRIRFWDKNTNKKVAFGDVSCKVNWKTLPEFSLTAGEPLILEDMAEPLIILAGTKVKTDLKTYTLSQPLTFQSRYDSDQINLIFNPVASSDTPQVVLRAGEDWNGNDVMSVAFWQKPSGATSIKASAIVGEERTELCNLIERRDIDHNQSHALYGYVPLLGVDEFPYSGYLSGELDSFTIELVVEGGVYDGKTVTLPWPHDYDLPEEVFDPSGSEGQENNAGVGNGGDSNDGGQRPNLPNDPPDEFDPPFAEDDDTPTHSGDGSNESIPQTSPIFLRKPPLATTPSEPEVTLTIDAVSASPDLDAQRAPSSTAQSSDFTEQPYDSKQHLLDSSEPDTLEAIQAVTQTPDNRPKNNVAVPVTAAVFVLASGAAIGAAGTNVTARGGVGKLFDALRKLFFRK